MNLGKKVLGLTALTTLIFASCTQKERFVPKPPTYLEISYPERTYDVYQDACGYSYNKPSYFTVKDVKDSECFRDIDFEMLNGTLHLTRLDMEEGDAGKYINYSIDNINEHKVMASAIYDTSFVRSDDKVFGTFFELQGNVASPFQFYLTDSVKRFVSGVVYFNVRPNYDSIRPVLDFVKSDLYEFMETIKWDEE